MSFIKEQLNRPLVLKTLSFEVSIPRDAYKHLTTDQIVSLKLQVERLKDEFAQMLDTEIAKQVAVDDEHGRDVTPRMMVD